MPQILHTESDWLTLGKASQLLGVHPTTLRAWADAGLVHAFLTPGGHRRFQLGELRAFLNRRREDNTTRALTVTPDQTLQQVRQQLGVQPVSQQSWYHRMTDEQRAKQRATGTRLLGLLLQFVSRSENAEQFIAEGRTIVQEYGREFAQANFSVGELAQAFLFFRRLIVNAAYYPAGGSVPSDAEGMQLLQRITLFMDELLVATLAAYEESTQTIVASPRVKSKPKAKPALRKKLRRSKS